jgi:hypothetical protein
MVERVHYEVKMEKYATFITVKLDHKAMGILSHLFTTMKFLVPEINQLSNYQLLKKVPDPRRQCECLYRLWL